MDFLQAQIDAALKADSPSKEDGSGEMEFDESSYNFSFGDFYFPESSGENGQDSSASGDDEQPPVLEQSITDENPISSLNQTLSKDDSNAPAIARAYQEDILPLEKCTMNGNRLSIEGCKYTFVRLNVRNNVYFRCVNCYGIYQKRRSLVTKSGVHVEVPSVGSLKLVPTGNGEIRGNPDRPSGIPHCCESEKFKESFKVESPFSKTIKNDSSTPLDPLSLFNKITSTTNPGPAPGGGGVDDDMIVPLEKCKFTDKKLEIEGCKYVFSRTQSGPRDYYRCSACIALYHKRHFRKLPTPKIGSLSLIRETGVLTGNPEEPRGLPHICDDISLHCPPIKADYKTKIAPLGPLLEVAKWNSPPKLNWPINNGISKVGTNNNGLAKLSLLPQKKDEDSKVSSIFQRELSLLTKRPLNDLSGPQNKIRKMVEEAMGPVGNIPKLTVKPNIGHHSPSTLNSNGSTKKQEDDTESTYPHTNDLQIPPKRMLPDQDLSHTKRSSALNACFAQFPKLPNQGRIIIFADTLLTEFQSRTLNPSTSIVRAEFPVTPSHLPHLCTKAKHQYDCFSKTKHVFFCLGYDVMRCMDLNSLERKINTVQNEFLELRYFLDSESSDSDRNVILTFVTVPEMGVLSSDLKALNNCMRQIISSLARDDIKICDWAHEYSVNPLKMANVEDRLSVLMKKMTQMCGVELLEDD